MILKPITHFWNLNTICAYQKLNGYASTMALIFWRNECKVINVFDNEIKRKVINAMQRWKDRWKNYTGKKISGTSNAAQPYQIYIWFIGIFGWAQGKDENDPNTGFHILWSIIYEKRNQDETTCMMHRMIWRWPYI